jgi:hypothetical protein
VSRRRNTFNPFASFGSFVIFAIIVLIYLYQAGYLDQFLKPSASQPAAPIAQQPSAGGTIVPGAPGALPSMPQKPAQRQITFKGCPPEGDGSDDGLNRAKNRVDEGNYIPIAFDAMLGLKWPTSIERRDRVKWSAADTAAIAQWEGIPIAVEGYLFDAKEEGPESPNCHGAETENHDFHVWLTQAAGEDRVQSIVFEPTPRVRANHPTWTTRALDNFAKNKTRVRISGWLMMDQEHPDQVGKTRGTIWEIHPVMKIEYQQGSNWTPL